MPLDPQILPLYFATILVLILVPGPTSLLVVSRSLFQGRWIGCVTSFGTLSGNLVHTALAAAGISAVVAASPALFDALRLAGAAYLAWLGARALYSGWLSWRSNSGQQFRPLPPSSSHRAFVHALLTNLLNPKVILFYLAFVPQFVSASAGPVALQTLLLGAMLAFVATVYHLGLVWIAAGTAQRLLRMRLFNVLLNGITGLLFIGFAIRIFLTERKFA